MHHNQFINDILLYISEEKSGGKIGGMQLAQAIREITELEIEEGGPYSFEPRQGLMSADIGLNLAIACFLALQDVRLPKLDAYIKEQLAKKPGSFASILDDKTIQELITKYESANDAAKENLARPQRQIIYDQEEQRVMDAIIKKFENRFVSFSPQLRERAKGVIEKTIKGNRDKQMSLMAYYTKIALGKAGENIEDGLIADLGLANIFFWAAFIIYDDFWDLDEAADPHLLPIANIFARYYTDFYTNLSGEKKFRSFFNNLMDRLDAANAWEIENCRTKVEGNIFYIPEALPQFGDYENKYFPASGHILSSLAIFARFERLLKTNDWENIIAYFKHYLIAMQLNDDAHDWEEDMRRGHLSTVVTLLLAYLKKNGWEKSIIDLDSDLSVIRKIFWFETMPKYIDIALAEINASRQALRSISLIENPAPLEQIINFTENIVHLAQKKKEDSEALLREYSI